MLQQGIKDPSLAQNILDGNPNSFWYADRSDKSQKFVNWIVIDLGAVKNISGFSVYPREQSEDGRILDWEFYCGMDSEFIKPAAVGRFSRSSIEKIVILDTPVKCRYVKFKALSEINGKPFLCMTDFNMYTADSRKKSVFQSKPEDMHSENEPLTGIPLAIVAESSSLAVDIPSNKPILLWQYHGGENQQYSIEPAGDGSIGQIWALRYIVSAEHQPARDCSGLADIPVIDVHTHIGNPDKMKYFVQWGDEIKSKYNIDIALWIDVGSWANFRDAEKWLSVVERESEGKIVSTIGHWEAGEKLEYTADDIAKAKEKGFVGFKQWWGNSKGIDDPMNDHIFKKMEELKFPTASAHINRDAMYRWENVLKKHPGLIAVTAHMGFFGDNEDHYNRICRMLDTYPNFYLDISFGLGYNWYDYQSHEKLRNFMIKYQDRILFGTDQGSGDIDVNCSKYAAELERTLRLLETDDYVSGTYTNAGRAAYGLSLPREVLEKIYYKNALRIYPHLLRNFIQLGYSEESSSDAFSVNEKVTVLWQENWYKAVILRIKDEKYLIRYEGYDASWDEWVGKERIKKQR